MAEPSKFRNSLMSNKRGYFCWTCQTDKPHAGGKQTSIGKLTKFICADCLKAREEKKK